MSDTQLALLSPDAGRSARSLAKRVPDPASGVHLTERMADVLPYLRRATQPLTAWQLSLAMLTDDHAWAVQGTVSRRLLDLERAGLARRVEPVEGRFGRSVWTWVAS